MNYLKESDNDSLTNTEWDEEKAEKVISIIAEPLIRERLYSLLDNKVTNNNGDLIDKRIKNLQTLKNAKNKNR